MTEKEKMLSGQWYDANFDKDLLEARGKADLLCCDFNMSKPGSDEQRSALSALLGTELPEGCVIAAGSAVTQDLPDNCVAAGVPASVKKYIAQSAGPVPLSP